MTAVAVAAAVERFTGDREDWPIWHARFRSALDEAGLLDLADARRRREEAGGRRRDDSGPAHEDERYSKGPLATEEQKTVLHSTTCPR